jgi:dTDP-4-amino-4,6-dideoxygalactose transaminase
VPRIPFNRPQLVGGEHAYIDQALASGQLSGNGEFCQRCAEWLKQRIGARRVLMMPSCTGALEMAALLAELGSGDEVIVPSFTFVSVANAFALRGAVPVFVDVRPDTLNLSADAVADAITDRTRAIVVVHYGGVAAEMESIMALAERHGLMVIEDAAHALPATYKGRPLGSLGHLATFSFHETKNVHCGEGGALAINVDSLVERAEILQEKGTDRTRFFRGEVDKYTWRDVGSSYLLSELSAAYLWAQLERTDEITSRRRSIWHRYHEAFEPLEDAGLIRRPIVPDGHVHSAHVYYVLVPDPEVRDPFIAGLAERGVQAVFHYVPLHDSPAGRRLGRSSGTLPVSSDVAARLVRLPLWIGLRPEDVETVIEATRACAESLISPAHAS